MNIGMATDININTYSRICLRQRAYGHTKGSVKGQCLPPDVLPSYQMLQNTHTIFYALHARRAHAIANRLSTLTEDVEFTRYLVFGKSTIYNLHQMNDLVFSSYFGRTLIVICDITLTSVAEGTQTKGKSWHEKEGHIVRKHKEREKKTQAREA